MTAASPRKHVYRPDPLPEPPSAELAALLDRHRGHPDALVTVLEEMQAHYGYLPRKELEHAARELGYPLSRVYGVATFYNLFTLDPPGRHVVRVCRGTACHVNGSAALLRHVCARLGVAEDETTPDGQVTLQTVACVGACSLAPVVVVDAQVHGRMTPDGADQVLDGLRAAARPAVAP
jgi:NADH:ubiquinone oxidoreductase subunit E